jgi:hypothetical protein
MFEMLRLSHFLDELADDYRKFTDYHPILIIVLQCGAYKVLYKCLSSLTVLECHRWRSCFQRWASSVFEGARTIQLLNCIL